MARNKRSEGFYLGTEILGGFIQGVGSLVVIGAAAGVTIDALSQNVNNVSFFGFDIETAVIGGSLIAAIGMLIHQFSYRKVEKLQGRM